MLPVNIAISLDNNLNILNKNIKKNKISFDKNHIPHITLLQFFTDVDNIRLIQNSLEDIDIKLNIEDYNLTIKKYDQNKFIYKIQIQSESLKKLHLLIFDKFKKYIRSPKLLENFGEEINNKLIPTTILNYYQEASKKILIHILQ